MAGRGQHFIPQHFQKPFVISETRDQIWMYRRGHSKGFLVSRGDAGKERDFYSTPSLDGQPTLDDLITDYEQKIFPVVDKLRNCSVGAVVPTDDVAEVIAHFCIRGQHLRGAVSELWGGLADTMYSLAAAPESVVGVRRLPPHRSPAALSAAIGDQIVSNNLHQVTGVGTETLTRLIYMGLREQLDEVTAQAREAIATVVKVFGEEAKHRVREVHRDILLASMAPPARVAQLQKLLWSVVEHTYSAAIIPDCVCIARDNSGRWQPILLVDVIALVVMPLTPGKLLVGRVSDEISFDFREFNVRAAEACLDFFLSKEELVLADLIGEEVGQVVRTHLSQMISATVLEALDGYLTAPISEQAASLNLLPKEIDQEGNYSFSIRFHDFGTDDYAKAVSDRLAELFVEFAPAANLQMLDGVTFANDYVGALNLLERGYEPSGTLETEESALGVGVAMPITVKRGEDLKTHLVLRGFLADYVLSEDEHERQEVEANLRYLLAGLTLDRLERSRFSGWMLQQIITPTESFLYSHSRFIFDTYFASRNSASSVEEVSGHLESLDKHLPDLISSCIDRRRRYRLDGDLDGFLDFTVLQIKVVLKRIAQILGTYAGAGSGVKMPTQLSAMLSAYDMCKWLLLFEEDISRFYENIDNWSNFEELFLTNRHFERWLLLLGIILEERPDGQLYIHVPLGSDADYLGIRGDSVGGT